MLLTAKLMLCAAMLTGISASAQMEADLVQPALPDAPSASMANARSMKASSQRELLADDPYQPLTKQEKLDHFVRHSYAPYTFVSAGLNTAYAGATSDLRYCCGASAWRKQYFATVADTEARYFFGNFLFPTVFGQDPRYLPKRKGSTLSRVWYAASRVLITRNDEGRSTFNSSEFLAVGFSQALRNAYYPDNERSFGRNMSRVVGTLQSDAGGYLLKEFMPDIKRIFKSHAPKRLAFLADKMGADEPKN
jgi:hypothetical protein